MQGHTGPAGGYTYIRNWMKTQAEEVVPIPSGDLVFAFDNDQVIGKTYHVRPDTKLRCSVVTSVCVVAQEDGALEEDESLMPSKWIKPLPEASLKTTQEEKDLLQRELSKTITERIAIVKSQVIAENGGIVDAIDHKVDVIREKRLYKMCKHCGKKNGIRMHKCQECKSSLKEATTTDLPTEEPRKRKASSTHGQKMKKMKICEDYSVEVEVTTSPQSDSSHATMYSHIPSNFHHVEMRVCDPVFLNPNSYDRVREVLRHVGKLGGIRRYTPNGKKHWCVVVCDGLPYVLALKVIRETLVCECGMTIFGKEAMQRHHEETNHHHSEQEFNWVLLQIGLGHVEMNFSRSFLELNWNVSVLYYNSATFH